MSRKSAEDIILTNIDKILPGSGNKQLYETLFSKMSDDEFDNFISRLDAGEEHLTIVAPNDGDHKLDVGNNIKIAASLGHDFFQELKITPSNKTLPGYTTPIKYLVLDLPFRRTEQLLIKKISIPEDNNSINMLTYQPTGKSKGAKVSYPQIQILSSLGLDDSLVELLKTRGGDKGALAAMNSSLINYGTASQKEINKVATGVVSTKTLRNFLTSMHLRTSL